MAFYAESIATQAGSTSSGVSSYPSSITVNSFGQVTAVGADFTSAGLTMNSGLTANAGESFNSALTMNGSTSTITLANLQTGVGGLASAANTGLIMQSHGEDSATISPIAFVVSGISNSNLLFSIINSGITALSFAHGATNGVAGTLNAYDRSGNVRWGIACTSSGAQLIAPDWSSNTNDCDLGANRPWKRFWCSGHMINSGLYTSQVGAAVASSGVTATISQQIHHVTGTAAIDTLTAAASFSGLFGGCVWLVADAAFSWTAAGNIAVASTTTTTIGKAYPFVYDPATSKWYPGVVAAAS